MPWGRDEIRRIVRSLLDTLGATSYKPEVGQWSHRTCNAWNVQLDKQFFGITTMEAENRRTDSVKATTSTIIELIQIKRKSCRSALETLTLCGAETVEEKVEKERLVFEFWALSRVLERMK